MIIIDNGKISFEEKREILTDSLDLCRTLLKGRDDNG